MADHAVAVSTVEEIKTEDLSDAINWCRHQLDEHEEGTGPHTNFERIRVVLEKIQNGHPIEGYNITIRIYADKWRQHQLEANL